MNLEIKTNGVTSPSDTSIAFVKIVFRINWSKFYLFSLLHLYRVIKNGVTSHIRQLHLLI